MSEKLATSVSCDDVSDLNDTSYDAFEEQLDDVKLNMLGLISNVMVWYQLSPKHVEISYNQLISQMNYNQHHSDNTESGNVNVNVDNNDITVDVASNANITIDVTNVTIDVISSDGGPNTNVNENDDIDIDVDMESGLTWVKTRREFRNKLLDGFKICPNYSNCSDDECSKFHVKKEDICNHSISDNYCNDSICDKIIIKKCRKGNKCKDQSCSFRHLNRE